MMVITKVRHVRSYSKQVSSGGYTSAHSLYEMLRPTKPKRTKKPHTRPTTPWAEDDDIWNFTTKRNISTGPVSSKGGLSKGLKISLIGVAVALVLIAVFVLVYIFVLKKKSITRTQSLSQKPSHEHSKLKRGGSKTSSSRPREVGSCSKRSRSSVRHAPTSPEKASTGAAKQNTIERLLTSQGKSIVIRSHYTSKTSAGSSNRE